MKRKYKLLDDGSFFSSERKETILSFTTEFDDEYSETPEDLLVPWQEFTRDFWSKDLELTDEINAILNTYKDKKIDLRPYMIENPFTVFTTDYLEKCVDLFRKMHVRSIVVISPKNGSLEGIITREDLF